MRRRLKIFDYDCSVWLTNCDVIFIRSQDDVRCDIII